MSLLDMPSVEASFLGAIGDYWTTRAGGYTLQVHDELDGAARIFWKDTLKNSAPNRGVLRCLDAGCGPGFFSVLLAGAGHHVVAVDFSEGMLASARRNFLDAGVEVRTMRADVQCLPFEDGSFDYIVSRNLVWNLERPMAAYREWFRLLAPGGRLLVADANHYLYYYDSEYPPAGDFDTHHTYMAGVNPRPINEIARSLPLSRKRRPEWDVAACFDAGFDEVLVKTGRRPATNPNHTVIWNFIIQADKHPDNSQSDGYLCL